MSDANKKVLIAHMVNRFLGWKIPETFGPDAGVSFDKAYKEKWGMPTGTNIFTGREAEQLFEYALEGFDASPVSAGADAKDAARYRWLRNRGDEQFNGRTLVIALHHDDGTSHGLLYDAADAAIDAAMSDEAGKV